MKKINGLWVAMVLFTAVSLACQLSSVELPEIETDNRPQPELPDFTAPAKGLLRSNPLPVGETIGTKDWTVDVLEYSRGQEAWEQLKVVPYINRNSPPSLGEEYVLLKMRITHHNKRAAEETIGISLTGSAGLRYFSFNSDISPPPPYLKTNLEGGTSEEGWYAFVIEDGETDLMLVVDEYATYDDHLVYAALEEGASLLAPNELSAIVPTNRGADFREPTPFGSTIINEDWELTITDVIVGDEAWDILLATNQFNDPPGNDTDYILVKIKTRYIGQGDESADMSGYHLRLLNGAGEEYETPTLVEPQPRFDFDLYPGAEAEGWMAYAGFKEDSGFRLRFNPTYRHDSPEIRYLSLDASGR